MGQAAGGINPAVGQHRMGRKSAGFVPLLLQLQNFKYFWLGIVGATYPRLAQLARIEGVVRVKALIADDGLVRDVVVESGHRLLKEVVTESLRQWRFSLPECKSSADGFQMLWRFTFSGSCEMHGKACRQTFVYEHPGSVSVVSELPNVNP